MPRDLNALKSTAIPMEPPLTRSPEAFDHSDQPLSGPTLSSPVQGSMFAAMAQKASKRDELHPYTQTLGPNDAESVNRIENAAFPPEECANPQKIEYRLRVCAELSMGIFTSSTSPDPVIATASSSSPVYSGAPDHKALCLGHILSTKGTHETVTDADMACPPPGSDFATFTEGHQEQGRTICIHSLAVLPAYHGRGLGKTLLTAYLQRMQTHGVAERVALIAHAELVPFYEKFGFENRGPSAVTFGGGGWLDMVLDLTKASLGGGGVEV